MAGRTYPFRSGDSLAECDRCGRKEYLSDLMPDGQWSELLVDARCYDEYNPQTVITLLPNINNVFDTRPEKPDTFGTVDQSAEDYPKSF